MVLIANVLGKSSLIYHSDAKECLKYIKDIAYLYSSAHIDKPIKISFKDIDYIMYNFSSEFILGLDNLRKKYNVDFELCNINSACDAVLKISK